MIKLIIIYDVVNIFFVKKYKYLRKLRVGVNRYTGMNWSTTTMQMNVNISESSPRHLDRGYDAHAQNICPGTPWSSIQTRQLLSCVELVCDLTFHLMRGTFKDLL